MKKICGGCRPTAADRGVVWGADGRQQTGCCVGTMADDSRRGGKGGWGSGWLLAPLPSANQLPVAKFVSNGFLINQLGQVDLRLAPLDTRHPLPHPPFPPRLLPGFWHNAVCFRLACWIDARVCLKITFGKLCFTLCGKIGPDEGSTEGRIDRIRVKYSAKLGMHIVGMNSQTLSEFDAGILFFASSIYGKGGFLFC